MSTREHEQGPIRGSGNFLADRGYADPEEARLKILLANDIALAVEARGLSLAQVAELTGLPQDDVARILAGVVSGYPVALLTRIRDAGGLRRAVHVEDLSEDDLARIRAAEIEPLQDDE